MLCGHGMRGAWCGRNSGGGGDLGLLVLMSIQSSRGGRARRGTPGHAPFLVIHTDKTGPRPHTHGRRNAVTDVALCRVGPQLRLRAAKDRCVDMTPPKHRACPGDLAPPLPRARAPSAPPLWAVKRKPSSCIQQCQSRQPVTPWPLMMEGGASPAGFIRGPKTRPPHMPARHSPGCYPAGRETFFTCYCAERSSKTEQSA